MGCTKSKIAKEENADDSPVLPEHGDVHVEEASEVDIAEPVLHVDVIEEKSVEDDSPVEPVSVPVEPVLVSVEPVSVPVEPLPVESETVIIESEPVPIESEPVVV
eukprot:659145_1